MKLTELKFISEKREKDFAKLGVYTCEDLVRLYPRDFLDLTEVSLISQAEHNSQILVSCEVLNAELNRFNLSVLARAEAIAENLQNDILTQMTADTEERIVFKNNKSKD